MKRRIAIVTGILLAGLIATATFAYGGGRGHGGWFCDKRGMMVGFYGMNLTAEQTGKMDALRDNHWKEMQTMRNQMFVKRNELRTLWLETNPDPAKIKDTQKEVQALRSQIEEKRTAFRLEVLNVLTPEQRTQFQRNNRERGYGHGRTWGKHPGGGPGPGKW